MASDEDRRLAALTERIGKFLESPDDKAPPIIMFEDWPALYDHLRRHRFVEEGEGGIIYFSKRRPST